MTQTLSMRPPLTDVCSISDVERDTGVAKETLRVWERRYAFPQPLRDLNGERVYPADQVHKLRLVQRLLDLGCRPGKIMHHDHAHLNRMAVELAANNDSAGDVPALQPYMAMIKAHQMPELRQHMAQLLLQIGLKRLVIELIAPLTTLVGQAWASGELAAYEEHLYSEALQIVLHNALYSVVQHRPVLPDAPRVLLTTVPQERHGVGLLMAEALCALNGAHCISLGVQTPIPDIVVAAHNLRADIVALSFSSAMAPRATVQSLVELRGRLPDSVRIWAGGSRAMLCRRKLPHFKVLDLEEIGPAIDAWRSEQAMRRN